jgi:hypothetical protein
VQPRPLTSPPHARLCQVGARTLSDTRVVVCSWMFAYPLVFSYQHRYFADERLATELYPGVKAFANYLKRMADAGKTGMLTWKKCESISRDLSVCACVGCACV